MKKVNKEQRSINSIDRKIVINKREASTGDTSNERFIEGYAAVFNQPSKIIWEYDYDKREIIEFYEIIEAGAFDEVLANDDLNCIHTINHNNQFMCARTISKTLELSTDEYGLKYRFKVNAGVTYVEDLYKLIESGDYYESSFVFYVSDDNERWEQKDNKLYRYISKIDGLFDTSTVNDGAYKNTFVSNRSLKDLIKQENDQTDNILTIEADFEIFLLKQKNII